ncbi:hypothetical protein ACYSNU_03850 [Enterococcus sp. LJL120]
MRKSTHNSQRKATAARNFRYNRFLMLRYFLAILFFANLYWGVFLLASGSVFSFLPIVLLLLTIPTIYEHVRLYGDKTENITSELKFNLLFHYSQTAVNLVLILITLTGVGYQQAFIFLTNSVAAKGFIIAVLLIGLALSLSCIRRIQKIQHQRDTHYHYLQELKEMN